MRLLVREYVVAFALVSLTCCSVPTDEQFRYLSPDSKVAATIGPGQVDATVATPTYVHLICGDCKIAGDPIFIADKVQSIDVIWVDDTHLKITARARTFKHETRAHVGGRKIEITYDIEERH